MTTPWERIDGGFRDYLKELGYTADDYNGLDFDRGKELNNYKQLQQQKQQANGEPLPKRAKNLANLISNNWRMAVDELKKLLEPHEEVDSPDPASYVVPKRMKTWKRDQMERELRELRDKLSPRLKEYCPVKREKVVIGIRLGTGCGKTHALVEAGDCLSSNNTLVYVTYNQNQYLSRDEAHARKAILIRLILAIAGAASVSTGAFLNSSDSQVCFESGVTLDMLRDLFVSYAKEQKFSKDLVIGVDEIKKLPTTAAKAVISELGRVASKYKQKTGSMCTVLVTSLIWENFLSESERSVELWIPPTPDRSAYEHFSKGISSCTSKQAAALFAAVGGRHMRSLVVARGIMKEGGVTPTVRAVYKKMKSGLQIALGQNLPRVIRLYVRSCIEKTDDEYTPDERVEPYTDRFGAVAPTVILAAYSTEENTSGSTEDFLPDSQDSLVADSVPVARPPAQPARSTLLALFDSATIFDDAPKQLEAMAKEYDFFRQKLSLPVVPANAAIKFPNDGNFEPEDWYRKLVFPSEMEEDRRSLFKQEKVSTTSPANGANGQETTEPKAKKEKTVCTGVKMTFGDYFHPEESNHPWIDRAFLAKAEGSDRCCLVLAQDKVNQNDFSKAVKLLNSAADLLSEKTGVNDVLCIANIIGAGPNTRKQSDFKNPYILVRNHEVEKFFSVNFAAPVLFSRDRHLLQYGGGETAV